MILVELFSKEDCHLCEEAKALLERVKKEIPFEMEERKISPGDPFYEEFKEKIPVVFIDRKEVFRYRVNERVLREKLRQAVR